jgi:hypothetical protein
MKIHPPETAVGPWRTAARSETCAPIGWVGIPCIRSRKSRRDRDLHPSQSPCGCNSLGWMRRWIRGSRHGGGNRGNTGEAPTSSHTDSPPDRIKGQVASSQSTYASWPTGVSRCRRDRYSVMRSGNLLFLNWTSAQEGVNHRINLRKFW